VARGKLRVYVRPHPMRTKSGKVVMVRGHYRTIPDRGKKGRGKKVIKIKRTGLINSIALQMFGKKFTDLTRDEMIKVLQKLKESGYTEKQMLGMMQAQVVFRKNDPTQARERRKFEMARELVARVIFPP